MSSATRTDRMHRAGLHYVGPLGFALAPIPAGSKGPERPGWNRPENAVRTPEDVERTARRGQGWGVVHSLSGTATLDADAPMELVTLALSAVAVDFPALLETGTPAIIGNPEKPPKLIFRVPDGYTLTRRALAWPKREDPKGREVVLELRARPVQDVLPPTIHPDTGEPYRWTVVPRRREDLPLVPGPLLGLWLAWDLLLPRMVAACPWGSREEAGPEPAPDPSTRQGARASEGPSIIDAWNERVPVAAVLERNGYKAAGKGRWIAPDSTTRTAGVMLCKTGRVYTFHESDPLAGPHAHDSFGALSVLEHRGDPKEAAQAAARELGLDPPPRRVSVTVAGGAR